MKSDYRLHDKNNIEVILPTLNEEKGLPKVLLKLKKLGIKNIVVLDGNSKDNTVKIAKDAGCKILMQKGNGKGNAFQTYIEKTPINYRNIYIMIDADDSYDVLQIPMFVKLLEKYDIVKGKRTLLITDFRSLMHVIGGLGISIIGSILFLRKDFDICTGYWAFRGSSLKKLHIKAEKFELEADIFSEAAIKKLNVYSIDTHYYARKGVSKLKWTDALEITKHLIKKRFEFS